LVGGGLPELLDPDGDPPAIAGRPPRDQPLRLSLLESGAVAADARAAGRLRRRAPPRPRGGGPRAGPPGRGRPPPPPRRPPPAPAAVPGRPAPAPRAGRGPPALPPAVPAGGGYSGAGFSPKTPPIRELTDYQPDELWVIQVNAAGRDRLPRTVDDIHDRRNEL